MAKKSLLMLVVVLLSFFILRIALDLKSKALAEENPASWIVVKDLKPGDLVFTQDGWQKIKFIEYIAEPVKVFNLSVTSPNTFFANDILAHNKGNYNGTIWDGTGRWRDGANCALRRGVSVSVTSGGVSWVDDALGGHFDVMNADNGSTTVTLTPPIVCGYQCGTWDVVDTSNGSVVTNGTGCVASFNFPGGDFTRTVRFNIVPMPSPAAVGGRVVSHEVVGDWYWSGGDCSIAACSGGSCVQYGPLNVFCTGVNASWNCNVGGAYYGTGSVFTEGDSVTCTLSNLPAGYTCTNPASCIRSGILNAGTNHWWFEIARPSPSLSPSPSPSRSPSPSPSNSPSASPSPSMSPSPSSSPSLSPSPSPCFDSSPVMSAVTGPCSNNNSSNLLSCCNTAALLSWGSVSNWGVNCTLTDRRFRVQIDNDSDFSSPLFSRCFVTSTTNTSYTSLPSTNGTYYWRVCAVNHGCLGALNDPLHSDCKTGSFRRINEPPQVPVLNTPGTKSTDNLGELENTDVSLQWSHSNFGCRLDGNYSNTYTVHRVEVVSYTSPFAENPAVTGYPGNSWCGTLASGIQQCLKTNLVWGTTYYWIVVADNGLLDSLDNHLVLPDYDSDCSGGVCDIMHFTSIPSAWYQTIGGDIYAYDYINSGIPSSASTYLMLDPNEGKHGIPFYGGDLDDGDADNIAESDPQWEVDFDTNLYSGIQYDYDFWLYNLLNKDKQTIPSGSRNVSTLGNDGETTIYLNDFPAADLNLTGGTVSASRKVVILYDGDVNILGNITVEQGGFFMVVSSGLIDIDGNVGLPPGSYVDIKGYTGYQAQLQGIYIADDIIIEASDYQLWVGGSLIAWIDISLRRSINGIDSVTKPSMVFIFRPDFIVNAPDEIKKVNFIKWQQVPG